MTMQTTITARRFRAHQSLKDHAAEAVGSLTKYFDGIVRADVVLSFERASDSLKTAEIIVHVHGATLTAREKSDEYVKSIAKAVLKIERQLTKYKDRLKLKNKKQLAKVKSGMGPRKKG